MPKVRHQTGVSGLNFPPLVSCAVFRDQHTVEVLEPIFPKLPIFKNMKLNHLFSALETRLSQALQRNGQNQGFKVLLLRHIAQKS